MSRHTLERISTGWFDAVIQQLDLLQEECRTCIDEESISPTLEQFKLAKEAVENFRVLAEFPNIPMPKIWPGVNGEIGIAFVFPSMTLELIIADQIYARVYNSKVQAALEMGQVSVRLKELAERSAA